ncbi:hypothetical protein LCGC14_1726460, partial [marine sediment metagenome]
MAETIVLVPKRKVTGFVGSADVAAVAKHIADSVTIPGASPYGETVAYWRVTKELRIPFGTDKFTLKRDQAGLTLRVSGDDTAVVNGASFSTVGASLFLGNRSGTERGHSLRYPNVNIPQGTTITDAYLIYTASDNLSVTTCNVTISGNDIDDAVAPTSAAEYNGLTLTTATVDWNNLPLFANGVTYRSDALTAIIQEIINRSGWVFGNALQLRVDDNSSSSNAQRGVQAFDGNPSDAPMLFISPLFADTSSLSGYTWMEGSNLHGFDESAIERIYIHRDDVDDTPVDGATQDPISSNWAYDHVAAADPHTGYVLHSLADAANDFLVASGANTYIKKTLAETLALISPLTTRGDIMFRNATVSTRLAKGADNTILAMGASDPEWKTPATIMGDLSGQAAAAFSLNSQNLTSTGTITAATSVWHHEHDLFATSLNPG